MYIHVYTFKLHIFTFMYLYTSIYTHVHTHRFFVQDEADEMLNVGFKDSVDKSIVVFHIYVHFHVLINIYTHS
jgi:hypothetical protein